jgi:hypothetical protein
MPQGHYDDWDNDDLLGAPSWRPWFRSHQALTSRQMNVVWGTALVSLLWHIVKLL